MAATFIFLSVLRTNTPSCIDLAMATLVSANTVEMKKWGKKTEKDFQKKNYHRIEIVRQKIKGKEPDRHDEYF